MKFKKLKIVHFKLAIALKSLIFYFFLKPRKKF